MIARNIGLETWVYPSVVDWMEVDVNASLRSNVRKGWGLSG